MSETAFTPINKGVPSDFGKSSKELNKFLIEFGQMIIKSSSASGSTSSFYAVPKGKTFFLISAVLDGYATANSTISFYFQPSLDDILRLNLLVNGQKSTSVSFPTPLKIDYGQTFEITALANATGRAIISGYLVENSELFRFLSE